VYYEVKIKSRGGADHVDKFLRKIERFTSATDKPQYPYSPIDCRPSLTIEVSLRV
jgi:hypothetical protein